MGMGGCRLDDLVNIIGEGGPRHGGLKIGPRIQLIWQHYGYQRNRVLHFHDS